MGRIRERSVFIGCSSQGLKHAEALKNEIDSELKRQGSDIECMLWNEEDLFELSYTTIENLVEIAKTLKGNGFAVMLLTPDDKVVINKGVGNEKDSFAARDNVIFELGFFMGVLGRERVYCVYPENKALRIPSDWNGVTNAQYHYVKTQRTHIQNKMIEPAKKIVNAILNADKSVNTIDSVERRALTKDDVMFDNLIYVM